MEEITVDEVINVSTYIPDKMIENLEYFHESFTEYRNDYLNNSNLNIKDLMDNSHRDIQVWLKEYIEYITNSVSRNANYLETLTVVIEELKKLRTDIQRDITENEEQLKSSKEKLSNINRSIEKLLNMRDEVQICKLLTNTTFTYKASSIGGYTVGANSKKREFFEMNVKEFSKDEIINNLYNCLAEVSSTTKGSDTNKRLNNLEPV